jgi:hypothetical protein
MLHGMEGMGRVCSTVFEGSAVRYRKEDLRRFVMYRIEFIRSPDGVYCRRYGEGVRHRFGEMGAGIYYAWEVCCTVPVQRILGIGTVCCTVRYTVEGSKRV